MRRSNHDSRRHRARRKLIIWALREAAGGGDGSQIYSSHRQPLHSSPFQRCPIECWKGEKLTIIQRISLLSADSTHGAQVHNVKGCVLAYAGGVCIAFCGAGGRERDERLADLAADDGDVGIVDAELGRGETCCGKGEGEGGEVFHLVGRVMFFFLSLVFFWIIERFRCERE